MQPTNNNTQPIANAASAAEDEPQPLQGTVRNSAELPQTSPSSLRRQISAASRSLNPLARSGATGQAARWVTRGPLTPSQRVISQLDSVLADRNILTTSDPNKRRELFSHLHAALSDRLTDVPSAPDELRHFLQPTAPLSHLTTLQVALAVLQGQDVSIPDALSDALQQELLPGISVQALFDRSNGGQQARAHFLQMLTMLSPQQQQRAVVKFSQTVLLLKRALLTEFMTVLAQAATPPPAADIWPSFREHSLLLPLDGQVEDAHLQSSLRDLDAYINRKAQQGTPLSPKAQSSLRKATHAMHKARCMFNFVRADAQETHPTPEQGQAAYQAVLKARELQRICFDTPIRELRPHKPDEKNIKGATQAALKCMFNAGFSDEYAQVTHFMLAKASEGLDSVCIKHVMGGAHRLALFRAWDASNVDNKEVAIVADSWNLGHAVLFEDSVFSDHRLGADEFLHLLSVDEGREHADKVEAILQEMIDGRFFIRGKTLSQLLREFRAQRHQPPTGVTLPSLQNVLKN